MSAEELRRRRDAENQARRNRRGWEAALGGRSSLVAPLEQSRTVGGVQPPPIGVAPDWSEVATFHHAGVLTVAAADPYPVVFGGAPRVTIHARVAPATDAEFVVYLNGTPIGSPIVLTTQDVQVDFEELFDPGDLAHIAATDLGTGDTEGVVSTFQFRQALSP